MRVIGGKYRGRRLLSPEGGDVRPTSDMVKESVFNVIQTGIEGAAFVDLFAGSGAIGIEALSRGARTVVFADHSKASLRLLQSNLEGISDLHRIVARDFRDALTSLGGKWDYVFIDPPYETDYIAEICRIVAREDLLEKDGMLIYEHPERKKIDLPDDFVIVKSRRYGKIVVDYIKKADTRCAVTGSFDPITRGHLDLIERAADAYDKVTVVIAQNEAKQSFLPMNKRLEAVEASIAHLPNVNALVCEGMVWEFCKAHGIAAIVRGYRNESDRIYEEEMALYNRLHGGIETIFLQADPALAHVSSTQVKERLRNGESLNGLIPKDAAKILKKYYGVNHYE